MVQTYKRKTGRASWDEEMMKLAILSVQKNELSIRKAAQAFEVPKDALHRRLKKQIKSVSEESQHEKALGAFKTVLSRQEEDELVDYIKCMDSKFYGLTINDLRCIVFDFVSKKKIKNPFNSEKGMADRDFVAGFLKRHPDLSLCKPEAIALNRVFGISKESISLYFQNLKEILDTENIEPSRIYNCDESGLTCVHKPVKVLSTKGKHVVSSATSGERGRTTTVLLAVSATGHYVPPMLIFRRKRMKPELLDRTPVGTIGGCSDSGWIDKDLFFKFIQHFVKETNCSLERKVLLILDGHQSHTKDIELIDFARSKGLLLLSLPPHASHKLQPLDRSFFKPLKSAFNAAFFFFFFYTFH